MVRKSPVLLLAAMLALAACDATLNPPSSRPADSGYTLASSHWSDVAKIRAEAQRLGTQVRAGKMTKVQAAQYLNRYRLKLVGANSVDDSVYDVYLRAAVDSQSGKISPQQAKNYVENALKGWQQRWPHVRKKPSNPAFANFLLEHMGMTPLK
jgi:hypothetical protein